MGRQIPNILSIFRIPASLLLLATYDATSADRTWISLGITLAIMLSDFLDGRIARHYAVQSKLGYLLDGLGDRAFQIAVYLILFSAGLVGFFVTWILIFREVGQYAVRVLDAEWHRNQSPVDRIVTQLFALVVQTIFVCDLTRLLIPLGVNALYVTAINVVLLTMAAASYSRILTHLARDWTRAINE